MERILEDISKWSLKKRSEKLSAIFEDRMGYSLNLKNPKTFSEKIQWEKLNETDERISYVINKATFKDYIKSKIGEGYTARLIELWKSPDEVDLERFNQPFVVKSNCASEGRFLNIVKGYSTDELKRLEWDIKETWFNRLLLNTNSFMSPYYSVEPCVIVEEYLEEVGRGAEDYKFLCFSGEPKYVYKIDNHFLDGENNLGKYAVTHFDMDWKYIDVKVGEHNVNRNASKPKYMQEMIRISKTLSSDFSFVRVDFLETKNSLYLSELTFAPNAGLKRYMPQSFDVELGRLWDYPPQKLNC